MPPGFSLAMVRVRRIFALSGGLLLGLAASGIAESSVPPAPPAPWDSIRAAPMAGGLAIFWDVHGDDQHNTPQAIQHGFKVVDLLNTYSDYPGNQREEISVARMVPTNPWKRPVFFERTIRRNIAIGAGGHDIFVHDTELPYEADVDKAWMDAEARAASGARTKEAFRKAYFKAWASWVSLPCKWSKLLHPHEPVGIYGPQPFAWDYWGFVGKSAQQLAAAHRADAELWKHIERYVDFYVVSVYTYYDDPGSIFYMAANIEENRRRAPAHGRKPIYAYVSLRYHQSNKELAGQELAPYLVEAAAVVPFFQGARGLVLWGYEPNSRGQHYRTLPLFMNSVGRISDLSSRIAKAQLIMDEPAQVLWNEKRPLQRKLRISDSEWIVMAVNPWQKDDARSDLLVTCGRRRVRLVLEGRHTDLFHIRGSRIERIRCNPA